MRDVRHETLSILAVLAIPASFVFFLPREALSFKAAARPVATPASAAFVTLTPRQEYALLASAKTTWQTRERDFDEARLPMNELPDEEAAPLFKADDIACPPPACRTRVYAPGAWEPSLKADAPERLSGEGEASPDALAFPKTDLLKL